MQGTGEPDAESTRWTAVARSWALTGLGKRPARRGRRPLVAASAWALELATQFGDVSRRTASARARGAPAPRATASPSVARSGAARRSARRSPRTSRSEPSSIMRSDFSTFFRSLRSRSRVRSSSVYSSSSVARSDGSVVISFSRRCSPVSSAFCRSWSRSSTQLLLEERELRLVHVVLLRRLEDFLLGELADFLDGGCGFGCHACRSILSGCVLRPCECGPEPGVRGRGKLRIIARLARRTPLRHRRRDGRRARDAGRRPTRIIPEKQGLPMTDPAVTLTLRRPDDWHLHLRDGAALAAVVGAHGARLRASNRHAEPASRRSPRSRRRAAYRDRILAALPAGVALRAADDALPDRQHAGRRDRARRRRRASCTRSSTTRRARRRIRTPA